MSINLITMGALGEGISGQSLIAALIGGEGVSRVSVIPVGLIVFGIAFSVFVGLICGYCPANRAVKIPALEAIKHN